MIKKILLLNSSYQPINFIDEKRAIKLLISDKDKVDIICSWNENINWSLKTLKLPSVLRLKYFYKRCFTKSKIKFSRKLLIKRDKSTCQYCSLKIPISYITIDHVVPKFLGGLTSFENCVISCYDCNHKKANKTLEQSKMKLLNKPITPIHSNYFDLYLDKVSGKWNDDWNYFT